MQTNAHHKPNQTNSAIFTNIGATGNHYGEKGKSLV